nr:MAG TPA: hypothetical protein [Caudoviricetes sp.]
MNFWQLLKRVVAGIAAGFAAMIGCMIVWMILFPENDSSAGIGLICLVVGLFVALKVGLKGMKPKPKQAPTQPISTPEPPKPPAPAKSDENIFPVAGVSFREDAIIKLARKNSNYSLSKSDIIDMGMTDKEIFRYRWGTRPAELVPEPDNPHDSNAVKVMVDGVHIGYIKAVSCEHVLQLLEDDRIRRVTCEIGGGPYKEVSEDFDYKTLDSTYSLDRGEYPIWAKVKITEKKG